MSEDKTYKLSYQFAGALMFLLQECLEEQADILPRLRELNLVIDDNDEVVVKNPPVYKKKDTL